ncbi:MAG TPA: histidine kinase N-terminal 7TM domain-containing protein [bacterium]|nr:histidine kinase N-terminal 7TM domain-containing protein [bacterium]
MYWHSHPEILPDLITVGLACILAVLSLHRRRTPGAIYFGWVMSAIALWMFCEILVTASTSVITKVFWWKASYVGNVMVPILWLVFVLRYTGYSQWLRPTYLLIALSIPVMTLVVVWSETLHPLFFSQFTVSTVHETIRLHVSYHGWYWIYLAYSYLLLFAGVGFLMYAIHTGASRLYRRQARSVILGALLFGAGTFLSIFHTHTWFPLDPMPLGALLGGMVIFWSICKHRFLELAPLARKVLVEHMPEGMLVIDTQDRIVDVNPSAGRMLGRQPDDVLGRACHDLLPGIRLGNLPTMPDQISTEHVTVSTNGQAHLYDLRIAPLIEEHDKWVGWLISVQDATQSYQAQRALEESKQEVREIFAQMKNGFYRTTPDGEILLANQRLAEMLGYTAPEELEGHFLHDLPNFDTSNREDFTALMDEQDAVQNFEATWTTTAGEGLLVHISGHKRYDDQAARIFYEGVVIDVTEQKQLQRQLQQAQKMESLGRLAGGVAHDFNNILTSIAMNADFGLLQSDVHPFSNQLQEIQREVDHGARITRQLLAFSRQQEFKKEHVELHNVIADLLKLIQKLLGEHITVEFNPGADVPALSVDSGQLEQVFINLAVNAKDAMSEGGTFMIETRSLTSPEAQKFAVYHDLPPASYVEITVRDTGMGIEPEHLDKIFDPFFTTKSEDEGTGLGLSIVHGIVIQHGGAIKVESHPGKGTEFRMYLPVEEAPHDDSTATESSILEAGTETILLVEDEPSVRDALHRMLNLYGYQVLVAGTGKEGYAQFQAHVDQIDLVVSDVIMPELTGPDLFERITRMNGQIPFIFISGYPDTHINTTFLQEHHLPFYRKPVSARTLLRAVREVLQPRKNTPHR